MEVDSFERYQDFDTGVLHRISSRVVSSGGAFFKTNVIWDLFPKIQCSLCREHFFEKYFGPKRLRQPLAKGGRGTPHPLDSKFLNKIERERLT